MSNDSTNHNLRFANCTLKVKLALMRCLYSWQCAHTPQPPYNTKSSVAGPFEVLPFFDFSADEALSTGPSR